MTYHLLPIAHIAAQSDALDDIVKSGRDYFPDMSNDDKAGTGTAQGRARAALFRAAQHVMSYRVEDVLRDKLNALVSEFEMLNDERPEKGADLWDFELAQTINEEMASVMTETGLSASTGGLVLHTDTGRHMFARELALRWVHDKLNNGPATIEKALAPLGVTQRIINDIAGVQDAAEVAAANAVAAAPPPAEVVSTAQKPQEAATNTTPAGAVNTTPPTPTKAEAKKAAAAAKKAAAEEKAAEEARKAEAAAAASESAPVDRSAELAQAYALIGELKDMVAVAELAAAIGVSRATFENRIAGRTPVKNDDTIAILSDRISLVTVKCAVIGALFDGTFTVAEALAQLGRGNAPVEQNEEVRDQLDAAGLLG